MMNELKLKRWIVPALGGVCLSCLPAFAQLPEVGPRMMTVSTTDVAIREVEESASQRDTEVIHERYPNRSVKVERNVTQDEQGNYINHGNWTMWDEQGNMLGTGEFNMGTRHGKWIRLFADHSSKTLAGPYYQPFGAPFISEAHFDSGMLNGIWTIYDSKKRKCSEWSFQDDELHGKAVWWYPTGKKRREVDYRHGVVDGELVEWDAQGNLLVRDSYKNGRKLAKQTRYYAPGIKQDEGWILFAREVTDWEYDFWDGVAMIKVNRKEGVNEKHGVWTAWDRNGQVQVEGRYLHDAPIGKWSWWHTNGQKRCEGVYESGKPHGQWTWWHANGMKQLEGEYNVGEHISKWTWWDEGGKVTEISNYSESVPGEVHIGTDDVPDAPVLDDLNLDAGERSVPERPTLAPPRKVLH